MTTGSPKNPLVVLVHGYLDDPSVWQDVEDDLASKNYVTVAPRFVNENDMTLDAFATSVAAAADAAARPGTDGIVFVGHSMGAQVAELAARKTDSTVRGIVLLSPVPLEGLALPPEMSGPLREGGGVADIHRAVRTQLSNDLDAEALERLVEIGVAIPAGQVQAWFDAWSNGDPVAAETAPPKVPTLIVTGDDPFVNDHALDRVAGRFAHATVRRISGPGHWPHVEAPAAVAAEVEQFLVGLADPAAEGADVTEKAWTSAFSEQRDDSFAATLDPDVQLEATVLRKPMSGRELVAFCLGHASQMYDELTFVHQAETGSLTFLEWHAHTASGISVKGVTILERNEAGLIARVAIHHRHLDGVLAFSEELGGRVEDTVGSDYFWKSSEA